MIIPVLKNNTINLLEWKTDLSLFSYRSDIVTNVKVKPVKLEPSLSNKTILSFDCKLEKMQAVTWLDTLAYQNDDEGFTADGNTDFANMGISDANRIVVQSIITCHYIDENHDYFMMVYQITDNFGKDDPYNTGTNLDANKAWTSYILRYHVKMDAGIVYPKIINTSFEPKTGNVTINFKNELRHYVIDPLFVSKKVTYPAHHRYIQKNIVIWDFFKYINNKLTDNYVSVFTNFVIGKMTNTDDSVDFVWGALSTNFCGENDTSYFCFDRCSRNQNTVPTKTTDPYYKCYIKFMNKLYDATAPFIQEYISNTTVAASCSSNLPALVNADYLCSRACHKATPYVLTDAVRSIKVCVSVCPREYYALENNHCYRDASVANGTAASSVTPHLCPPRYKFKYTTSSYQGTKCVNKCPSDKPFYDYTSFECLTACAVDKPYLTPENECSSDCRTTNFTYRFKNNCMKNCTPPYNLVLEGDECTAFCPDNTPYILNNKCVAQCDSESPKKTPSNYCVKSCQDEGYFSASGDNCYESCPYTQPYFLGTTCYSECPPMYKFFDEKTGCQKSCPANNAFFSREDYVCKKVCTSDFPRYNVDTFECMKFCYGEYENELSNYGCTNKCPISLPFLLERKCINACPQDYPYVDEKKQCVKSCPLIVHNGVCTQFCQRGEEYSENLKKCVKCADLNKFDIDGKCYSSCTDNGGFLGSNNECVICKENQVYFSGLCLESCPSGALEVTYQNRRICNSCGSDFIYRDTCLKTCIFNELVTEQGAKLCINCENKTYFHKGNCVSKCESTQIYNHAKFSCIDIPQFDNPCSSNPCLDARTCREVSLTPNFGYHIKKFECDCVNSAGLVCQYNDTGRSLNGMYHFLEKSTGNRMISDEEALIFDDILTLHVKVGEQIGSLIKQRIYEIISLFLTRRKT